MRNFNFSSASDLRTVISYPFASDEAAGAGRPAGGPPGCRLTDEVDKADLFWYTERRSRLAFPAQSKSQMQTEGSKRNDGTGPLHRLPAPPSNFMGRASELRDLKAALKTRRAKIFSLHGMEGVGKTALALAFANDLAEKYPDAQLYIAGRGTGQPRSPTALMRQIIRTSQLTAKLPEDEAGMQAAFAEALRGRRALLLVDNASSSEGLASLLPDAGCLMIVTSRERMASPQLYALKLDPLPQADAEGLLLQMAPCIGKLAAELAELAGGLPLALQLAGSALAAMPDLDPADYADQLLAEQWEQSELDEAQAALALSYKLLEPELQRCWRQLSVFPGDFGRLAAGAVWALDEDQVDQVLAELWRRALVAHDGRSRRFRMHELARTAASARLEAGESKGARQRRALHYVNVLEASNLLCLKGDASLTRGLRLFDLEQANILAGQAWAGTRAAEDPAAAKLASDYQAAGAKVLSERLSAREHIAWLEAAGRAAQRLGDRGAEGVALSKLGSAYRRQSEPRWAIDYYQRQLRIARETGDRQGEGAALGNLGLAYAELGNIRRAVAYYQQHVELARELGDRRGEASTSWNLGLAYEELGNWAAAIAAMQICLDFERAVGHPDAEADAAAIERLRARLAGDGAG
jgi:tetratricopeptide (TPR) repeat protein